MNEYNDGGLMIDDDLDYIKYMTKREKKQALKMLNELEALECDYEPIPSYNEDDPEAMIEHEAIMSHDNEED